LRQEALVTGAAGFIGSHIADRLLDMGWNVLGLDDLSGGDVANLTHAMKSSRFRFVEGDLLELAAIERAIKDYELVFHLAADPEVRVGAQNPDLHFKQNLLATFNLLEALRKRGASTKMVFASTSTIYGEPSIIPTPEDYGPLLPISVYGATKLGCEALAASYMQLLPLRLAIFRFANVVGNRAKHGVIYDFIMKLRKDPHELEVLGDGTQTKSYLHIDDCTDAFLKVLDDAFWQNPVEIYNIGSEDQIDVLRIAQIVTNAMGLNNVSIRTTRGSDGRAWPGDVKTMLLDITKIKKRGWEPKWNSQQAVTLAAESLIRELTMNW